MIRARPSQGPTAPAQVQRQCDDERGQQGVDADQDSGVSIRNIDAPSPAILVTTVKGSRQRVLGANACLLSGPMATLNRSRGGLADEVLIMIAC